MAITFPTTIDSFSDKVDNVDDVQAVDINDVQDAIEALETKMGINSSAVTASLDYKVNNFFASGRKVYLYENTAPTGWSIVAVTDSVLSVKGGSNAYNANGGTQAGTWTQPNHTHTGPSHTHTGPSHNHQWYNYILNYNPQTFNSGGTGIEWVGPITGTFTGPYMVSASGDVGPNADAYTNNAGTGATGAGGTGATGNGATEATYRPYACIGIIVTKT